MRNAKNVNIYLFLKGVFTYTSQYCKCVLEELHKYYDQNPEEGTPRGMNDLKIMIEAIEQSKPVSMEFEFDIHETPREDWDYDVNMNFIDPEERINISSQIFIPAKNINHGIRPTKGASSASNAEGTPATDGGGDNSHSDQAGRKSPPPPPKDTQNTDTRPKINLGTAPEDFDGSRSRGSTISLDSNPSDLLQKDKDTLQRLLNISDLLLEDAGTALHHGDLDEMKLMHDQIGESIGKIERLGSDILESPGGLTMDWEEAKHFRNYYRNKTKKLKDILKPLKPSTRKLSHGSNYSQTSQDSHQSTRFQSPGDATPRSQSKPPQKNDILSLPNPPNVPVKTPVETGTKTSTSNLHSEGNGHQTAVDNHANSQHQDTLKAILEKQNAFQNALLEKVFADKAKVDDNLSMKLPKVQLAPFYGDISDWLRFHSAFSAEVDKNQNLHYSSKYNYLQALIKGKARETIKGLPYSQEGYEEAKKLLKDRYGRPSHLKRQTIQDLEDLEPIGYSQKLDKVHKFTEKFKKTVRTLNTLGALIEAEGHIFKVFEKLGPIRESITQRDDAWESWKLERLAEELEKYCQRSIA